MYADDVDLVCVSGLLQDGHGLLYAFRKQDQSPVHAAGRLLLRPPGAPQAGGPGPRVQHLFSSLELSQEDAVETRAGCVGQSRVHPLVASWASAYEMWIRLLAVTWLEVGKIRAAQGTAGAGGAAGVPAAGGAGLPSGLS